MPIKYYCELMNKWVAYQQKHKFTNQITMKLSIIDENEEKEIEENGEK